MVVSDKVTGNVTLRLENTTPRDALKVIAESKGLWLEEKNNVLYVRSQEERAKEPTETADYTFSYANSKDVQPLLDKQLTSGVASQFDTRTNTIFYREAKSNLTKIRAFLEKVDQPTQQVMIEARLVEVTANPQQNYGINWAGTVGGATPQTFRYGGTTPTTATIDPTTGALKPSAPPTAVFNNGTFQPFDQLLGGIPNQNLLAEHRRAVCHPLRTADVHHHAPAE